MIFSMMMSHISGAVTMTLLKFTISIMLSMLCTIRISEKDKNNIPTCNQLSITIWANITTIQFSKSELALGWQTKLTMPMVTFFIGLSYLMLDMMTNFQITWELVGIQGATEVHQPLLMFGVLGPSMSIQVT